MTSDGFGYADPPAGSHYLFALPSDCFAIARLRSAIRDEAAGAGIRGWEVAPA